MEPILPLGLFHSSNRLLKGSSRQYPPQIGPLFCSEKKKRKENREENKRERLAFFFPPSKSEKERLSLKEGAL